MNIIGLNPDSASLDPFGYAALFTSSFSILLSVVIALFATVYVFRSAYTMRGGLLGKVLIFIGFGMFSIVCATLSIAFRSSLGEWFDAVNTTFFVAGYACMVLGAHRLMRGITN